MPRRSEALRSIPAASRRLGRGVRQDAAREAVAQVLDQVVLAGVDQRLLHAVDALAGLGPRVAVGVEVLALLGRARLAVVVGLENDVAFVVRHEGLDLGAVLAVALAEVDATAHLVRVVGRGAVAELGLYLWTYSACDNWRTMKPEVYVSTDIEADGPIPGPHSMLSIGSAAFTAGKNLVSTFSANLDTLPGTSAHPATKAWWDQHPEAWNATRRDCRNPADVMKDYVAWLNQLPGKPVFVGYPAAYDFMFVYWYLMRFAGESPFSHSALDIKTFAMALLGTGYRDATKRNMPKKWFDQRPHTHVALDDAIEQGALFCNMLDERLKQTTGSRAAPQ